MKTVVVGMSGGVDSSVSALLLKNQGYRVIGLFMKNWEENLPNGSCQSEEDFKDFAKTADFLDIPYYTVNFTKEYREEVFSHFLSDLQKGLTPNPDILCNREIKFKVFLDKALELGADFLATGHYARLDDQSHLLKGHDPEKDQSYFLYQVEPSAFQKVLFPIGHLTKQEVRKIARQAGLPTAEKKDSTGICFIGKRDFQNFLKPYLGYQAGKIKTLEGQVVGEHLGVAYYTLGQRRGLKLGGEGEPWYVVKKDPAQNILYVERGKNHPALFQTKVQMVLPIWQKKPESFPLACKAKIRYRQKEESCTILPPDEEGRFQIVFQNPQRAVTAGQSIVFYLDAFCLGGGIIA